MVTFTVLMIKQPKMLGLLRPKQVLEVKDKEDVKVRNRLLYAIGVKVSWPSSQSDNFARTRQPHKRQ